MNGPSSTDGELFAGGPLLKFLSRVKFPRAVRSERVWRAELAVLVSWVPLAILTIVQGSFLRRTAEESFAFDIGVNARLLLALPLMLVAEALVAPRLAWIVRHFTAEGFIVDAQRAQFDVAVSSTQRLAASVPAEVVVVALAYALVAVIFFSVPSQQIPPWYLGGGAGRFSWAGWWHTLISLPMLLIVMLGLMWRWCLWVRLLWRISRLDLAVVPSHPDGAAGLMFVSYSVRAYALHAMAFGVIIAGPIANRVLYDNVSPLAFSHLFGGVVILVLVLSGVPLLLFAQKQLAAWQRGVFEYGALAAGVGRQFESKWLAHPERHRSDALGSPNFSATTDLYSVVANVYRMRLFLFDMRSFLLVAFATILPFIPVMLLAVPLDTLLSMVRKLLL